MKSVIDYLDASASRVPEKIAYADVDTQITYAELYDHVKKIGTGLQSNVRPGEPIPFLMEKGVRTLELFFGAVYAGCCYSLIEPSHPIPRMNQIVKTLEPSVLITDREHLELARELDYDVQILVAEDLITWVDSISEESILPRIDFEGLYINFTSGSTGVPKGVLVGQKSVVEFIDSFVGICGITEEDVIGNQAPFDFDVSVKDIYSTLKLGATMQIIPKKYFSIPTDLLDFLCDRKVSTLIWAVSALCIVTTVNGFTYRTPSDVRKVIFSGEIMPIKHLNKWRSAIPEARFINVYGPTEITCNCTYYIIEKEFEPGEQIPIGIPFPTDDVFLLEGDTVITEPEKPGEICVGGTSLAIEYYNNPEQTDKVFTADPRGISKRIYHTGDLAYYLEDGNLMFMGRKDHQIKHQGHRIELSEIELAMDKIPGIVRCCVLYDSARKKIKAYYEGSPDKKTIQDQLRVILPWYMIPERVKQMDALPLNKNGKIDRKALAEL